MDSGGQKFAGERQKLRRATLGDAAGQLLGVEGQTMQWNAIEKEVNKT